MALRVAVAADCNYIRDVGSAALAREELLRDWGLVADLYKEQLNLEVKVVQLLWPTRAVPQTRIRGILEPLLRTKDLQSSRAGHPNTWRKGLGSGIFIPTASKLFGSSLMPGPLIIMGPRNMGLASKKTTKRSEN